MGTALMDLAGRFERAAFDLLVSAEQLRVHGPW